MNPAVSPVPLASRPRALSPPRAAQLPPSEPRLLAEQVLLALFNAPPCGDFRLGVDPPSGAMIAALYSRMVAGHDVGTLYGDQDVLLQLLRESIALGPTQRRYRLSSCSIGKALNIMCLVWRARARIPPDTARLVALMESCAVLIQRQGSMLLETCGVIMFHLGELITCHALSDHCARLICEVLEPKFRAAVRSRLHEPLTGGEVALGLISTLRASEQRLVAATDAPSQRTAADALLVTMHMLLDRQPQFLRRCESSTLGLIARHAVLYLRQLEAVQGEGADAEDKDRQFRVARLVRTCIEEVRRRPSDSGAEAEQARPGFDCRLRYAPHYYQQWLSRQDPYVQAWLALRLEEGGHVQAAASAAVSAPRPVPHFDADRDGPLSRLGGAAAALADGDVVTVRETREHAITCTQHVMSSLQAEGTSLQPDLRARAQMLLDIDTVFQHLDHANPLNAPRYDATLETLRVFMQEQATELVDAGGVPLLGPAVSLPSGLRSWQRLLLSQLLT